MSTKNVDDYKYIKHISYFWKTAHIRVWNHKKDNKSSAKWKEVKGKPDKPNVLILKTKVNMKEGPDNI